MKTRGVATATVTIGVMLALTSCASSAGEAAETAAASTPTVAPAAPSSQSSIPTASPAEEQTIAPGAYLDFTDGAIEATPGTKVLFFHASWCPKCRALDEELKARGAPDGLTVFKVDYDSRTDLRQKYGVTLQTTVVFVDDTGELISRSVLYDDPSVDSLVAAIP